MKLYGSQTSPYVRKLRLLFQDIQTRNSKFSYEFVRVDLFSADREEIKSLSPIIKIPILEVEGRSLFDSRVIFNYFVERGEHPRLSIESENFLSVVDGCLDTLIQRLLLKRSQVDLPSESPLGRSHQDRLKLSSQYLNDQLNEELWDFPHMSLYALIDWAQFRELHDFQDRPRLLSFFKKYKEKAFLQESDPRR